MPTDPQQNTYSEKYRMVTVEDQLRCQQATQSKLQAIEQILIGLDGTNGMRSELRQARQDIEKLEQWKIQAMTIFLLINTIGVPVAIALIIKFIN